MSRQYESMIAAANLENYQYHLVKVSAANKVNRQHTAGGDIFGVLNNLLLVNLIGNQICF